MNDDVVLEMTERKNPIIISKAVTDEYVLSLLSLEKNDDRFSNRIFEFLKDFQCFKNTLSYIILYSYEVCSISNYLLKSSNMCAFVD